MSDQPSIPLADTEVGEDPLTRLDAVIDAGLQRLTWAGMCDLYTDLQEAGVDDPYAHIAARTGKPNYAGLLRTPTKEVDARDHFARQMRGHTEVGISFGRIDVVMDGFSGKYAVEVEPYSSYPTGVRQAIAYGQLSGHVAALAVYGRLTPQQARSLFIRVSPWVQLFLLSGDWQLVDSADVAESVTWTGVMWCGRPSTSLRDLWVESMRGRQP